MLFILSLTFGVLRFRIGNVLFLKHGYAARWLARVAHGTHTLAGTWARTAPVSTQPLTISKNFQNSIQKKFAFRFQNLRPPAYVTARGAGAGGALKRSRRLARLAEKAPYVKYIQGDVHSIYKLKLGVRLRHARAMSPPLPTLTS